MSIVDKFTISSSSPDITQSIGASLTESLQKRPVTIWLRGDLGAGKTTFVQGLARGLGISQPITSPTYALENRFDDVLIHVDLYRLDQKEAQRIIEESDGFEGVRVVEWAERLLEDAEDYAVQVSPRALRSRSEGGSGPRLKIEGPIEGDHGAAHGDAPKMLTQKKDKGAPSISIMFDETSDTDRTIEFTFNDINLPTREEIESMREEVQLPEHIRKHCDAVGAFAKKCAENLIERGIVARTLALQKAGELHDMMRFVDFQPDAQNKIPHALEADEETKKHWKEIAGRYPQHHEEACAQFLSNRGYPELGSIIRPHGLRSIDHTEEYKTIEQKLLYYADKRVMFDQIVTLEERFNDFVSRYGNGTESEDAKRWRERTMKLEEELFGIN